MIAAAAELFAEHGYGGTTMSRIAKAAGVSPETVQAHGPKAALIVAAFEYVSFGVTGAEQNILELDVGQQFAAIGDRDAAVAFMCDATIEVHGRGVGVWRALTGAATSDPELDGYLVELIAGMRTQSDRVLGVCRDRGWVRDDVPFGELAEWTSVITGIEVYDRMVARDRVPVDAYRRWFISALHALVLR